MLVYEEKNGAIPLRYMSSSLTHSVNSSFIVTDTFIVIMFQLEMIR